MQLTIIKSEKELDFQMIAANKTLYPSLRSLYEILESVFATTVGTRRYTIEKANCEPYIYDDMLEQVHLGYNIDFYYRRPDEDKIFYVIVRVDAVYLEDEKNLFYVVKYIQQTDGNTWKEIHKL